MRKAIWVAYLVVISPLVLVISILRAIGDEVVAPLSRAVYRWAHHGQPMAAPRQRQDPRKAHLS